MPSVTLGSPNGHNPVSGLSFRKVAQDPELNNGGSNSFDDVTALRHHGVRANGVKPVSPAETNDASSVQDIKMRLKKGRAGGPNRNGRLFEKNSAVPLYNNNAPLKAFPMDSNTAQNGSKQHLETNGNIAKLPKIELDLLKLNSTRGYPSPETVTVSSPRQPLQRLNGHGRRQNQNLSSELTGPHKAELKADSTVQTANGPCAVAPNSSSRNSSPPLKSALHKTGRGPKCAHAKAQKEAVKFAEYDLPPGMLELHQQFFTPGAKACFQHGTDHEADFPLLKSTDAAILRRRSSISQARKNQVSVADMDNSTKPKTSSTSSSAETKAMVRSRSNASDVFIQPDLQILKACWGIILSFMGDEKDVLPKHRPSRTDESPRKKYFANTKRLWRHSTADSGSPTPIPTPSSPSIASESRRSRSPMFVPSSPSRSVSPLKLPKRRSSSLSRTKKAVPSASYLTVLDKVHFLVNTGLTLAYLRDEIYCLVMKQLVHNPSAHSTALGWILFALVTGSFPPSEKISHFVQTFVDHHQHAWSRYCGERLRRSIRNGPRTNPPCSLEIQAARSTERILFPVICMDNSAMTVTVDPATTSQEMLESMAGKSRIGDPFGYCIVLQSGGKILNLGAGRFPVMDALSQVEMFAGRKFSKSPCRLYYRRDIFSPRDLFSASDDTTALRLTFFQICGGVKTREYFCKKAPDLSLLVAHQYCIRYGVDNIDDRKVSKFCERCLPAEVYKSDRKSWSRMVTNTLHALRRKQNREMNSLDIMAQVVRYAMLHLTDQFVRTYSIMTFTKVGGVCTYTSDLSLSLSHKGATVRQGNTMTVSDRMSGDESDITTVPAVLMEIPAENLKRVKLEGMSANGTAVLTVSDCAGGSYEITSSHGPEMYSVLFRFIRDIATGADKESKA